MEIEFLEVQRSAIDNDTGETIHVRKSNKKGDYRCIEPECSEKVYPRQGEKNQWSFAHYPGTNCNKTEKKKVVNPRDKKEDRMDDVDEEPKIICQKYDRGIEDEIVEVKVKKKNKECGCNIRLIYICNCEKPNFELVKVNNQLWCKKCDKWKCRCNQKMKN